MDMIENITKIIDNFEKKTRNINNNDNNNTDKKKTITLSWILKIKAKIKKEIQKFWSSVSKGPKFKKYFMQKQR